MPASGPVYQPTTVSYEQQSEWSQPGSYMSQSITNTLRNMRFLHWIPLGLGIFFFTFGFILVIEGAITLAYSTDKAGESEESSVSELTITVLGALSMAIGILLLGVYVRFVRRRKGCPCFPTKEERLARQLDNQAGNGQILTLNPSTDLLVTAQYGPVSEIAYQPPAASEQEETHKLMATDNKECNEENERMLESDPRIVLRPLSHNEEA